MELSRSAGLTFGYCVVRYEEICPFRQPLEIAVVTVGVTGEYDFPAAYADTPAMAGTPPWITCVASNRRPRVLMTVRIS